MLPAANDQAAEMVSMYARKAPYHYGWDWGPRFVTSGIGGRCASKRGTRRGIDDVQVHADIARPRPRDLRAGAVVAAHAGRAKVTIAAALAGRASAEVESRC